MNACHANRAMPPYPGFLIQIGARGDYVRQIQNCLNGAINAGLNPDGIFGPLTQAAVINFQSANGLNPDGIVGPLTWNALMQRCAGATTAPIAARVAAPEPVVEMPEEPTEPATEVQIVTDDHEPCVPPQVIDYSAFNLETAPCPAEPICEPMCEPTPEPECACEITISKQTTHHIPMQINMSNLLMYCLLRQMKR